MTDFDTNRLQVLNLKGRRLCTRNDLGLKASTDKGLAWGVHGQLAVANGEAHAVRVWC